LQNVAGVGASRWLISSALCAAALSWSCSRPPAAQTVEPVAAPEPDRPPHTLALAEDVRAAGRLDLYETALLELGNAQETSVQREALARLGVFLLRQNRHSEAAEALRAAGEANAELRPFLLAEAVTAHEKAGQLEAATQTAEKVIAEFPGSTAAVAVRLRLPVIFAATSDRERASAALDATETIAVDELTERAFLDAGEALDRAGWGELAAKVRMRMLTSYPQGRFTENIYQRLAAAGDRSPLAGLSFDQLVSLAERLTRFNRHEQALPLLELAVQRFPQRRRDPVLRHTRLRALFNSRRYEEVIRSERFKRGEPLFLATEILRAHAFWRLDRNPEFVRIIESILERPDASRERLEAKLLLSRYYLIDARDLSRAARLLEQALAEGGSGQQGENLWTLGWIHTLAGNDQKALETFDRYIDRYPDADYTTNALFWSGKVYDRRGNPAARDAAYDRLIASFPYSYYAYRARELRGISPAASPLAGGAVFPRIPADHEEPDTRLAVVHQLRSLDLQHHAAAELRRIAGVAPSDPVLAFRLAEVYVSSGQPLQAIIILQKNFRNIIRHGGSDVPSRFWEILYPRLYWSEIEEAAGKSTLDPYLISSIIRQESGFEPTVVSSAGAVGLMQIMPAEAPRIAARAGLDVSAAREELFNPRLNVILGAAEFVQKLEAVYGNQILAIASYNAGERAVGRWIARTPLDDVDVFIDSIPFSETRLYVKNVMRNHHEYRRIYGNGSRS
jgi:tetratricopeptide (TPR) repeat protein